MSYKRSSPIPVIEGGTGDITLTDNAVLVGNATAGIVQLAVGANGQVLIGATAADPAFATLTSSDGSVSFTTGANSLSLQVTGGTTSVTKLNGNSGTATPTAGAINVVTANSTPKFVGSGSTLTLDFNANSNVALGDSLVSAIYRLSFRVASFDIGKQYLRWLTFWPRNLL